MNIFNIAPGITIFNFDDIEDFSTNVTVVEKKNKIFLIDTYTGPQSIIAVKEFIQKKKKRLVIINTHFHWDHIWGNCVFDEKSIISHIKCKELILETWDDQLNENKQYISGNVTMRLPGITFEDSFLFKDEGLELFYSPGHTIDSISVFDHQTKCLFVGDSLERPIVYVEQPDVELYMNTLKVYKDLGAKRIIGSHTINLTEEDIVKTFSYLEGLKKGKEFFLIQNMKQRFMKKI